jgi:hypothetical protein
MIHSLASPVPWSPYNNYSDLSWIGSRSILLHCLACRPPCYNKKRARESGFLPSLLLAGASNWSWGRWRRLSPGMADPTPERWPGGSVESAAALTPARGLMAWWEAADQPSSAALGREGGRDCCCVLAEEAAWRGVYRRERGRGPSRLLGSGGGKIKKKKSRLPLQLLQKSIFLLWTYLSTFKTVHFTSLPGSNRFSLSVGLLMRKKVDSMGLWAWIWGCSIQTRKLMVFKNRTS